MFAGTSLQVYLSILSVIPFSLIPLIILCYVRYSLAEALDIEPPVMPENGHITRVTTGDSAGIDSSILEALWDDEDTRGFYECLPDLRFIFVALLTSMVIPC